MFAVSLSLPCEHLKGMNEGLFTFMFLAPRAVPGHAGPHIRAPRLRVWSHVSYFSIPPARGALLQPEEENECFLPSLLPFGLLAREGPRRPRAWGSLSAVGGWCSSTGAQGPPALGWGAFRISSAGIWRDASCRGP